MAPSCYRHGRELIIGCQQSQFQSRVRGAFSEREIRSIGKEAEGKGIKPEDGIYFLEEKYFAKTGRYFMEEIRLLFNEYVILAANIIAQARYDTRKFYESGSEIVKTFNELINEKKWEDAAKLFDAVLRTSN